MCQRVCSNINFASVLLFSATHQIHQRFFIVFVHSPTDRGDWETPIRWLIYFQDVIDLLLPRRLDFDLLQYPHHHHWCQYPRQEEHFYLVCIILNKGACCRCMIVLYTVVEFKWKKEQEREKWKKRSPDGDLNGVPYSNCTPEIFSL